MDKYLLFLLKPFFVNLHVKRPSNSLSLGDFEKTYFLPKLYPKLDKEYLNVFMKKAGHRRGEKLVTMLAVVMVEKRDKCEGGNGWSYRSTDYECRSGVGGSMVKVAQITFVIVTVGEVFKVVNV